MKTFLIIIVFFFILVTGFILTFKIKNAMRQREKKKNADRKLAIQPDISFYLKKSVPPESDPSQLVIKNAGKGKAVNIVIKDFHHPEEKDWCFKFSATDELDPGMEAIIDAQFFVGEYKASNSADQLWMFDPDHDHDFATIIKISYKDIDENVHSQTIAIGENKKSQKINKLKLIKEAMSNPKIS